jgi:hypothetical protein
MEQTTQQITQKPSLPIKTKIAAWWMITIGGIVILFFFKTFFEPWGAGGESLQLLLQIIFGPIFVVAGGLFLACGIPLLLRRKFAWWLNTIVLLLSVIVLIILWKNLFFLLFLPPLILLLLDRKNFWKVAK